MKVEVYPDTQAAGRAAARAVSRLLRDKPGAVLGFATGHTMIPVYGEIVRLHEEEGLSLARATTFNLDEYVGTGAGDPDSYYEFMMSRLVRQTDLPESSFHIPDGKASDPERECKDYENRIERAGGIDLQLLGLGRNGHIGFNEPGSPRDSRTRVIGLSDTTREVNSGDFRKIEGTPERAITMGIANILEAKGILLVVTGWEKAGILHKVLVTPPTPDIPATFLHQHPDVTLVADRDALEEYHFNVEDPGDSFEVSPQTGGG